MRRSIVQQTAAAARSRAVLFTPSCSARFLHSGAADRAALITACADMLADVAV